MVHAKYTSTYTDNSYPIMSHKAAASVEEEKIYKWLTWYFVEHTDTYSIWAGSCKDVGLIHNSQIAIEPPGNNDQWLLVKYQLCHRDRKPKRTSQWLRGVKFNTKTDHKSFLAEIGKLWDIEVIQDVEGLYKAEAHGNASCILMLILKDSNSENSWLTEHIEGIKQKTYRPAVPYMW